MGKSDSTKRGTEMKKERRMQMKKSVVMAACAAFALAGQAAVVISWDGSATDYTPSGQATIGSTGGSTNAPGTAFTKNFEYSTTVAKWTKDSPANYSGTGAQNIYAGYHLTWSNSTASTLTNASTVTMGYLDGTGTEEVRTYQGGNTSSDKTMNYAILFGLNTPGSYGFDDTSSLTAKLRAFQNTGVITNRWIVVADGVTYVSQTEIGALKTTHDTYTLSNPDEIYWAAWTPGSDMSFGNLTFNVAGSSLENITLAGYAENSFTAGGTVGRTSVIAGVTADLSVIPEPATVGMLGLGALVSLVFRRFNGV